MRNWIIFAVLLIAFLPAVVLGQTVFPVVAGTDQIDAALATAPPGSIIELTTSGGLYNETFTAVIDRSLTIRAAAGLAEKPIWVCGQGSIQIQVFDDLTLQGISFDGAQGDSVTHACVRTGEGDAVKLNYNLMVDNCDFKNYWDEANDKGYAIYGEETTQADSVYITDCTFNHMFREAVRFKDGEIAPGSVLDFKLEHCTFWDIGDEAIYVEDHDNNVATPAPAFLVNHVTVFNAGSKNIYPKEMDNAVIKNSIVSDSKEYACRIYGTNSAVQYFLYYLCPSAISLKSGATEAQLSDIQAEVDPMFADSANGDFTLDASSPAVGAGENNETLGDKRWWTVAIDMEKATTLPTGFQLYQNFPNPFNPTTNIKFDLASSGNITLQIFNILGQEIATLINGQMSAGSHSIEWNALAVASGGVYLCKLSKNDFTQIRKMVLLK